MKYQHLSESVSLKKVSEEDNLGVFHIEGLYTGYGVTLGNALRRTLLSSLPGAAITSVKIKGVGHEFSTIPGILEDVVEICLNLKKVRFQFPGESGFTEPEVLTLHAKKEGEVTAADINDSGRVTVVNKDQHIATITDKKTELNIEFEIEKGIGYVPVEQRQKDKLAIGVIAIDAIFSPVNLVNFNIENIRVGQRIDFNKVTMEVETDGSIEPEVAMKNAAEILVDHFRTVSELDVSNLEKLVKKTSGKKKSRK